MGPLPRSSHGHITLLVSIDTFIKWVELIPLGKTSVEKLSKAFRERILSRFGAPKIVVTDKGTLFTSQVFQL